MYFITSNDFFSNRLQDVTNTLRHVTFSSRKVKNPCFYLNNQKKNTIFALEKASNKLA